MSSSPFIYTLYVVFFSKCSSWFLINRPCYLFFFLQSVDSHHDEEDANRFPFLAKWYAAPIKKKKELFFYFFSYESVAAGPERKCTVIVEFAAGLDWYRYRDWDQQQHQERETGSESATLWFVIGIVEISGLDWHWYREKTEHREQGRGWDRNQQHRDWKPPPL